VVLGDLRPQAFIGVCRHGDGQSWKTGLNVINFQRHHQLLSHVYRTGEFLALVCQIRAVIFHKLQGPKFSKTLLYVISCSVMSAIQDVIPYWHRSQPSGFQTPCLTPMSLRGGTRQDIREVIGSRGLCTSEWLDIGGLMSKDQWVIMGVALS
jgi:hypothetical protein